MNKNIGGWYIRPPSVIFMKSRLEMKNISITIITGLSGSGKSTALDAFEDAGFYCVDNLPVDLLPKFLELPMQSAPDITGLAFVMDLREKSLMQRELFP